MLACGSVADVGDVGYRNLDRLVPAGGRRPGHHRGMIRGALLGPGHLVIQRTRYFDFRQQPAWHGLRRLG